MNNSKPAADLLFDAEMEEMHEMLCDDPDGHSSNFHDGYRRLQAAHNSAVEAARREVLERGKLTEAFAEDGTPMNWKGAAVANAKACGALAEEEQAAFPARCEGGAGQVHGRP